MRKLLSVLGATILLCFVGCKNVSPSLKSAYKDDFYIGSAIGNQHFTEKDSLGSLLVQREFNTVTPENVMKAEVIHPEPGRYDFTQADQYVAYAQKHNMHVVGHTLVWHSQLPRFVEKITSADSLNAFLKDHINTVAGRYAGKVHGWDVVNEALNEDGTMRKSLFFEKLGDAYVINAFKWAEKAAPNTELYYNDYNIEQTQKRAGVVALVKKIKASGARIDGVGIQGHWSINGPPVADIEKTIDEFAALGLKVMFTELDLTALPNPWDLKGADVKQNFDAYIGDPKMDPYKTVLPDSMQTKLATGYADLFKVFLRHKAKVTRVTFWGVNDGHSWLNGWPIKGRTNHPLLFDRAYQKKTAYATVMALKAN